MSKIYEALLRAEQDRAEQDRDGAAERKLPAFPSENAPPAAAAQPPVQSEAVPVSEPPTQPLTQAPTSAPVAQSAVPPFASGHAAAAPTSFGAALASSSAATMYPPAPLPPASFEPALIPALSEVPPVIATQSPAALPNLPARPSDDRSFSPEKVRRAAWDPDFAGLPALQERGQAVEQFRSLRSRMFEFRDLNRLKSVMVSSGLPQEGKSFIAINLAISFARHKASRVLLIDGDMRRSTLHKLLGADGSIGLCEYLAGSAGLLDIMQQIEAVPDESPARLGLASLTFIPGGSESDKAADLSGNPRFTQLMQTVAPHYDWIVVDSAPVNVVADGVNLARACDGVLLVARGGVTKYESAQRALVELKASTILGFVLNAVETLPQTGGYYGYENYDSAT
jgi:capsular exopolysaccharide synthesis family protein